jgi:hypothetical protein
LGLVGVVVSIALALPSGEPEPAAADPLPEVTPPVVTPVPVVPQPSPATVTETLPTDTAPAGTLATEPVPPEPVPAAPATASKKPSRAGTRRPQPGIVPKPKTPCTPDRFDYPACLKQ